MHEQMALKPMKKALAAAAFVGVFAGFATEPPAPTPAPSPSAQSSNAGEAHTTLPPPVLRGGAPVEIPGPAPKPAPRPLLALNAAIDEVALHHGVDAEVMRYIVQCESRGNPQAIGDNGNSFGLVQIHLPAHPHISKEQAFDPHFALTFLAQKLSEGKGRMWTCYKG